MQSSLVRSAAVAGPWGPISVAATPRGVAAIDILTPPDEFQAVLERRFGAATSSPEPAAGPAAAAAAEHLERGLAAVRAYLDGDPNLLEGLALDLEDRPAWDRAVLGAVRAIPWGSTASYGTIATEIGRRGAGRAVGGAVGRNPISLAIPCHRVIAGDGSLGGYGGGWWGSRELRLGLKRDLLGREGVRIENDRPGAPPRR